MSKESFKAIIDTVKEIQDMRAHWKRLIDERPPEHYAGFNIGKEDLGKLDRWLESIEGLLQMRKIKF